MVRRQVLLGCAWICCLLGMILAAEGQAIRIVNAEGQTSTVNADQVATLPHVTVSVSDHDKPAQFEGVPLAAVLSSAGIQLGGALHGSRMTEALLVEAAGGYKAVFALAEVDPAFATREIILADKRDGKTMDAKEGPFRIVAPGISGQRAGCGR